MTSACIATVTEDLLELNTTYNVEVCFAVRFFVKRNEENDNRFACQTAFRALLRL